MMLVFNVHLNLWVLLSCCFRALLPNCNRQTNCVEAFDVPWKCSNVYVDYKVNHGGQSNLGLELWAPEHGTTKRQNDITSPWLSTLRILRVLMTVQACKISIGIAVKTWESVGRMMRPSFAVPFRFRPIRIGANSCLRFGAKVYLAHWRTANAISGRECPLR